METKENWLWKKTSTERFNEPFTVSYQLSFVTREPLLEEQFIRALGHLYRKVPLLRTCFGERDGETWLREMPQENTDFEMISDDTKDEDLHAKLMAYNFKKQTGPLWCVKLRPESRSSPNGIIREGVPGFPHKYTLFLGINHAITDGTSNATICGYLIQTLENVLAGKPVNDEEQLGNFISDEKTKKVIQEQMTVVKGDPELQGKLSRENQVLQGRHSILKTVYKGVGEEKARTVFLTREYDIETTAAFIKRCRAEGVTVAFTAIANFALVDLLVNGGLEQDSYSIRSTHVLNARRYLEGDASQYLGCHITVLTVICETPRNFDENFWNYAKPVNVELQTKIKSGYSLQMEGMNDVPKTSDFDPFFEFDYCITNMGDVTQKVTEGGDHVQVVKLMRIGDISKVPLTLDSFLHTFRGRFTHTLAYNTSLVNSHMAQLYYDKIDYYIRASLEI
ncbi:uncharacterized protein LOC122263646 [Penaeus japonicus]|uniref:uncharacterized protein LOC122263646 n=1 Tax=Penaeus japonicus TaxID=27405 RepID=UPI001C713A8A|nr:uncharacterized protein LOC122263646 [Penaeus japonicus]